MTGFIAGMVIGAILATAFWIRWALRAMDPRAEHTKPSPTHKVSFYGVHCYMHDPTGEMWGVNWVCDKLILPMTALHNTIAFMVPGFGKGGFPLLVLEEYPRDETSQ